MGRDLAVLENMRVGEWCLTKRAWFIPVKRVRVKEPEVKNLF